MLKYQIAKKGTGDYGRYLTLPQTMETLKRKVSTDGGIRLIKGAGNDPGPVRLGNEPFRRTRVFLEHATAGETIALLPDTGPFNWIVRVAEFDPTPASFLAGTPAIDAIATAVYFKYNDVYGIVNLGIYANKPGEHSKSNAIDIGVSKPDTADDIHEAILDIGGYLRFQMLADMEGEPGLPVNGDIVMQQVCSREDTSWHYYGGVPHVSHTHVSGWPNPLPGWV